MTIWNIFIDTSVFVSSNFSFKSKTFSTIRSLCNSGHVVFLITDITIEEIYSNILQSVTDAELAIKKAGSKAKILRNIEEDKYEFLFSEFDKNSIVSIMKEQFDTFLKECKAITIKATEISPKNIFLEYFQGKPPFGARKKKNEFPDAFVISAICEWCKENRALVQIASEDNDFHEAVKNADCLKYFPSLSKLIEEILSDENFLIDVIHAQLKIHCEKLHDIISDHIKGYDMIVQDADPDAEAYIHEVTAIELFEESVIRIEANTASIVASGTADIKAEVNCYDPDSWFKDPDDKSIYYWDKIEGIFERRIEFEVEFDIQFDKNDADKFKIEQVVVNNGNLFSFYLDEDALSYYK